MKKTFVILLFLAFAVSASGQEENIETIIRQMDQKNASVIVTAHSAAMVALLAADFTINRSTGTVVSGRAKNLGAV